jgi:hypothetical protein
MSLASILHWSSLSLSNYCATYYNSNFGTTLQLSFVLITLVLMKFLYWLTSCYCCCDFALFRVS